MVNLEQQSGLSPKAREVNPHLKEFYREARNEIIGERTDFRKEMREEHGVKEMPQAFKQGNLVNLANKITRGEASEGQKVDFRIHLAEVKSRILSDPNLTDRAKLIRGNIARQMELKVLGLA